MVQRTKATYLTPPADMKALAGTKRVGAYERVVSLVEAYFDDALPATNYGRRMLRIKQIGDQIAAWEKRKGKVKNKGWIFTPRKTEQRRTRIALLKASLAVEEADLKTKGKRQAHFQHTVDRTALKRALTMGKRSGASLTRNSVEWIERGKAHLYAVTPTGDSEARIKSLGLDPDTDAAFFPRAEDRCPGHVLDPKHAEYNEQDLNDFTGIKVEPGGLGAEGWNTPGHIAITRASTRTTDYILETLRHEVQHDADQHAGRDESAPLHTAGKAFDATGARWRPNAAEGKQVTGKPAQVIEGKDSKLTFDAELALNRYKTEYRAYSYEAGHNKGPHAALDNTRRTVNRNGVKLTARQAAIFKQIYDNYAYVQPHWDHDTALTGTGRTFRSEVAAYVDPGTQGFNKYNSVRVDDFFRALDAIGAAQPLSPFAQQQGLDVAPVKPGSQVDAVDHPKMAPLLAALAKLQPDDAEALVHETPAMMQKLPRHLKGVALAYVRARLRRIADGK